MKMSYLPTAFFFDFNFTTAIVAVATLTNKQNIETKIAIKIYTPFTIIILLNYICQNLL